MEPDYEFEAEQHLIAANNYTSLQVEVVPMLLRALYWQNKAMIQLMKENKT